MAVAEGEVAQEAAALAARRLSDRVPWSRPTRLSGDCLGEVGEEGGSRPTRLPVNFFGVSEGGGGSFFGVCGPLLNVAP